MTFTAIITLLTSLFAAIPTLGKWWDQLVAAYVTAQISRIDRRHVEAIKKAINMQDQRDIEIEIGNPNAGNPSGIGGTRIVDKLPNVLPLLLILLLGTSCISKKKLIASIWLNNAPLPQSFCETYDGQQYGFYRRLNNGKFEFKSLCDMDANHWLAIHKDDFKEILDATIPNQSEDVIDAIQSAHH